MGNFAEEVFKRLKADEKNYKYVCFCPKKNQIFHLKSAYRCEGKRYVTFYDGKIFGLDLPEGRTKNWIYLGVL